jgi:hypothetical protein
MYWFDLLLLMLASFRLTHLIVSDDIMEPFRQLWAKFPFVHELVTCYWCCGIWVSALLVLLHGHFPTLARPIILIFAVAAGQALLERWVHGE